MMMLTTLRQRNFALLWLGGLISQTGDWLLQIGLPVAVYLLTGSVLATSLTLIVAFIPNLLPGSVAGVFVDRWNRRRVLLIANLLLAAGLLPLLLIHDKSTLWILYPVLLFEAMIDQFIQPAQSALIPQLVDEEQLVTANSLYSVSSSVSRLAGAALGDILLATLGLRTTVLLDLVSFLFGAQFAAGSLMTLLGMILASALGDRLGPVLLLNIQGSGYFLSGVLVLLSLSRMLTQQTRVKKEV